MAFINNEESYLCQDMCRINEDNHKNLETSYQPCKFSTKQSNGCNPSKTWQLCGICRAPRKMDNMDVQGRYFKNNDEIKMNIENTTCLKIPKFETLPGETKKGSLCKSLECLSSPAVECSLQEEGYTAIPSYQESNELEDKWEGKELRQKNPLFQKQHPQYWLTRDFVEDVPPHRSCDIDCLGKICPHSIQPKYPTHLQSSRMRRFIPHGHIDHFQTCNDCVCARIPRRLRVPHEGKEHHSVIERNPIVGILGPHDVRTHPSKRFLIGPLGTYHCNSLEGQKVIPVTEHRAQYTSCKPWIARDIYSSTNQASEDNKLNCKSVHPSVNRFLYEDKYAVVS